MKRVLRGIQRSTLPNWMIGALSLGFLALGYLLMPILSPFIAAAIIAYMVYPIVRWLNEHRLPRTLSAVIVLLGLLIIILAFMLIVVPLFVQHITASTDHLPALLNWLQNHVQPLLDRFSIDFTIDSVHIKQWFTDNSQALTKLAGNLSTKSMALLSVIVNFVLFPFVLFYFLRDGDHFVTRLAHVIPRRFISTLNGLVGEIDSVLGEFLRGELVVILIMSLFYTAGLWITGLSSSLPIGIISGILVFVPYLGISIGLALSTLAALVQFGTFAGVWPVWAVLLVGHMIEGNFITPKLVGNRIGLHPVMVIFALLAFGQLLGFAGLLLALPLAAILQVLLKHGLKHYLNSRFYQKI